ncbi:MAG TPA: hypothetical protein VHU90_02530 [Galbitalea sp.]|nr:hypothetical protein [Galbitalea sp.]
MINNQKNAFGTPLRKHLMIGATSVVAAGALLGAGVAGASAATVQPTPATTHSSSTVHTPSRIVSLIEQLRSDLFQGQISGSKVQALATRIADNSKLFSVLPVNLQNDLTTLKNAPAADAVAQAGQIKSTALSGGYGAQIKDLATELQSSAKLPMSKTVIAKLRQDLISSAIPGAAGANLPSSVQSGVTSLKGAASPEATLRLLASERAAVADSLGPQLQTLTHMVTLTGGN